MLVLYPQAPSRNELAYLKSVIEQGRGGNPGEIIAARIAKEIQEGERDAASKAVLRLLEGRRIIFCSTSLRPPPVCEEIGAPMEEGKV